MAFNTAAGRETGIQYSGGSQAGIQYSGGPQAGIQYSGGRQPCLVALRQEAEGSV